jgi:hypothetical protein
VQIPVEVYTQLVEASRDPSRLPRRAPAGYALGNANPKIESRIHYVFAVLNFISLLPPGIALLKRRLGRPS